MIRTWLFLIAFSAFWLGWQTLPLAGQQGNWPQFLGPNGNGQAASAKLPFQWSEKENVAWKTLPLPIFQLYQKVTKQSF